MTAGITCTAADTGDLGATCCYCQGGVLGIEARHLWGLRNGATVARDPEYYVCRDCFGSEGRLRREAKPTTRPHRRAA
jgi:hypothetical protein